MISIKTKILTFFSACTMLFILLVPNLTFAVDPPTSPSSTPSVSSGSKNEVCKGAGLVGGASGCSDPGGTSINNVIKTVVNFLSVLVGLLAVVMIIVAGVKFITSGGNPEKVSNARSTILYAVIGLIIVAFAQIIVQFVLKKATK